MGDRAGQRTGALGLLFALAGCVGTPPLPAETPSPPPWDNFPDTPEVVPAGEILVSGTGKKVAITCDPDLMRCRAGP